MARTAMLNLLLFSLLISGGHSTIFNYENHCTYTVWTAANPDIGDAMPETEPDTLTVLETPDEWTGSFWLRTKCSYNASSYFSCESGDCGTGELICQTTPPIYPVTLLNFVINKSVVSYEVSLNHGYNVPVRIQPFGGSLLDGSGQCPMVGCIQDLSNVCPASLVALNPGGMAVGCYSACDALKDSKYCCTGDYSSPQACQPNEYSQIFKQVCPLLHTYPGDNIPPIYKCNGATGYNITFCPS